MTEATPEQRSSRMKWILSVLAVVLASALVGSLVWFFTTQKEISEENPNNGIVPAPTGFLIIDKDCLLPPSESCNIGKPGTDCNCTQDSADVRNSASENNGNYSESSQAGRDRPRIAPLKQDFHRKCMDLIADNVTQTNDFVEVIRIAKELIFIKPRHPEHLFCRIYLDQGERAVLVDHNVVKTGVLFQRSNAGNIVNIYTTTKDGVETLIQLFKKKDSDEYCVHDDYWLLLSDALPPTPRMVEL
ncbi:tyrosine kinase etk, putative [Babesia ovis]|uniref:Tyrosine kinase etk, putative n=1 Tax=Babesia ovis TaxID=5869 RepID=A0A9W5T8N1_BABOV|nr:tyrosine kinase etk, putative [Babesia ovis]